MKLLSRRSIALASLALALGSGAALAQEEEKVLNVCNWSDYIGEETIRNFEKETGIKVRYDNFDNNEIVHAKLVSGRSGYDVVVPSSNWAKLAIRPILFRLFLSTITPKAAPSAAAICTAASNF